VDVGVSIGRTMGEAEARVLRDPTLAARTDLRTAGVFGTFEDAQQRVLAYARAGADGLRATLAEEHDVADLLAHLRAVTVGPVGILLGRSERS
jgi:2-methylisocitrate lyase-like PEP mutase family enzyme